MGPVATYAYERQLSLLCHEWPKAKTSSFVKRGECEKEISTVELDKLNLNTFLKDGIVLV
ncbi:unnamed protein product [Brassica napus]|uniref:(rape) hypothetical protein n=1 Tax=Brassica napus TaxID=3708 RepID=A0A817BC06_BRANA|nr:unnamed protein product [Brassica napus]